MHAFYSLNCDVFGGLAFLAPTALLISEDPHQRFLNMASILQCFSGCALVDSIISDQLSHVVVVDCVEFLSPLSLLQAATKYLIQERTLILEVSDIFLIVILSRSSLGKKQFLIDHFSEYLSNALLNIVGNDGVLDLAN